MERKPGIVTILLGSLMLLVIIMSGCRDRLEPDIPDYVEYGWELFAEENYREAIDQFEAAIVMDAAYADSWNGLGWTYAKLGIPDTSVLRFSDGVDLSDTSEVGTEILAGRSFAWLALGLEPFSGVVPLAGAVADAKAALILSPAWEFEHDATITHEHLTFTVATGYYGLAEFDSCLAWVRKLDGTFSADVATRSGRARLAAKLEALEAGL
ncbi:MAG: hypothetical protein JSW54_11855 [Fidelibacterota bacterium]|nr:MAG: hypothetical protein JSW54_11855 [Candidatus Neomarinimicrobiota bacterium]